ncbi:mannose/glucose-specific lectin-like [Bidens hawaiensis]|uniref:mannose/glucose-specific lectin-like n=1 Tax=Bidens hawaiensis TaxID=980011 RepID=UPI00404B8EEE
MKITIDHGDLIYSLMFTSQCGDMTRTSEKFGGWNGGENVSEITFEGNEEIKAISGTVALSRGTDAGNTIVSSISFVTNKRTHGPFGNERGTSFLVPWEYGSFAGFYGLCGYYIDSIGVYVKAPDEIMKIGTWGKSIPAGPQNNWSFQFERNYHLMKITIDHGDLIYSLMFTSQCGDITHTSEKFGGWNGGEIVSEITFEGNEEIKVISGTVALSRGTDAGNTIISSVSFLTNKRTHGPFGNVRGTPFSVPWEYGSLAGFYGLCGYYIDSIGVYLKATKR